MHAVAASRTALGERMRFSIRHAPDARAWVWAVALGMISVLISLWRVGVPSLMGDEAVTVSIANRSPGALWAMVTTNMDAVHAAYYAGMHVWFSIFGADAVTLRVPSAIAVGAAVAAIVMIGGRFVSRTVGIVAGVLLIATPVSLLAGAIGRSPGTQLALLTWLAFALLVALEKGRVWRWVIVAVLVALSVVTFLFTAFVVVAFGAAVLLHRPWRARLIPFAVSAATGALPAIPVAILGYQQRAQVSWIEPIGWDIFRNVFVTQWFSGTIMVDSAYPTWDAYVTAIVFLSLAVFGTVIAVGQGGAVRGPGVLGAAWLVLPSALLIAVSLVGSPWYSPEYLIMCAPAVALLAALGIAAVGIGWVRIVLVVAIVALSVAPYLALRGSTAHGTDWTAVADTLQREAQPGDGVLVEDEPWDQPHILFDLYPDQTARLSDISFHGRTNPVALWGDRDTPENLDVAADVDRVWVVGTGEGTGQWDEALETQGFEQTDTIDLPVSSLTLFAR
jgi:mannosyltransferase